MMVLASFVVAVIGYSTSMVRAEVKTLNAFLIAAEDVQPNFEESLRLYTENTELAIGFVHSLRPSSKAEYIEFISAVESIGQSLNLSLDLESLSDASNVAGETLDYKVDFFGGEKDLDEFLKALEALPYYIRIDKISFRTIEFALSGHDADLPNISLNLKLYVK